MSNSVLLADELATTEAQISVLEEKLKALHEARREEANQLRESVRRKWKFTFAPKNYTFEKVFDPAVIYLYLQGEVVNAKECIEAGHSEDDVRPGGMGYYFNKATGKIIMPAGGGHVFVETSGRWGASDNQTAKLDGERVIKELGDFIVAHPEGGDVTSIILSQRYFGWK